MAYATMKQMLETGVHFGHQTRRWNPKMRPFIFGARNGIHIIDLQQTVKMFQTAYDFIAEVTGRGGKIIFVGTKRQAQEAVKAEAERSGQYSITHRWMGGTLTNFQTIRKSIDRLKSLETMFGDGTINKFPKNEIVSMSREVVKLNNALGGIKDMDKLPQAAFIIDPKRETIAVLECRKLGIPVVAITDTNCDPDVIDYIIPGNDDAIRAIKLFVTHMADACMDGVGKRKDEGLDDIPVKDEGDKEERAKKAAPPARKPRPTVKPENEVIVETKKPRAPKVEAETPAEAPAVAPAVAPVVAPVETAVETPAQTPTVGTEEVI